MSLKMKRHMNLAQGLVLSMTLLGCSGLPDSVSPKNGKGGGGAGTDYNGNAIPGFKTLALDAATTELFAVGEGMQINFIDSVFVLSLPNGKNVTYDVSLGHWGTVVSLNVSTTHAAAYSYGNGSYVAIDPDVLTYRVASGKTSSFKTAGVIPANSKLLGVGPGFYATTLDEGMLVVREAANGTSSSQIKNLPVDLSQVQSCVSGCAFWGFNGVSFYTVDDAAVWTKRDLPLIMPKGKKILKLALQVSLGTNGKLSISNGGALADDGSLWILDKVAPPKVIAFADVKVLTTKFCISCHSADGFDQEATLKSLKSKFLARLALPATAPLAMPPPNTAGNGMAAGDKKLISSWLEQQEQGTALPDTGTGTPGEDTATVPVTGALKTLSEANCSNCHLDAKFKKFWISFGGESIDRINSGSMPIGKVMSAADKAALIAAINAL
jgi:hypothetical protein